MFRKITDYLIGQIELGDIPNIIILIDNTRESEDIIFNLERELEKYSIQIYSIDYLSWKIIIDKKNVNLHFLYEYDIILKKLYEKKEKYLIFESLSHIIKFYEDKYYVRD